MAENITDSLICYVSLNSEYKDCLGAVRLWDNLKMAFDGNIIWIKDLNANQIDTIEIQSIPAKEIYYLKENKLFLRNSLLPFCNIPSLLWTPILRALPVSLPQYNNNYFGIKDDKISIRLVESEMEKDTFAIKTSIEELNNYINAAPAVRLKLLKWTILSATEVLIVGTPVLPIQGQTYWKYNGFLIPTGYDFNYSVLKNEIIQHLNYPDSLILWDINSEYTCIDKSKFVHLTIGSFRNSFPLKPKN